MKPIFLTLILVVGFISVSDIHADEAIPKKTNDSSRIILNCTYAREYITALEYLRSHSDFVLPEKDARSLAKVVSRGCTGSAQRFIKVSALLRRTGLSAKDALREGQDFSGLTDLETKSFISIFLSVYLPEALDLDLGSSLKMARSLTVGFSGDVLVAQEDFQDLVKFCVNHSELALPRPQCAPFAIRIAQKGEKFKGGVSNSFIQLFQFLISEKGPHLITGQALHLGESILDGGPGSIENFMIAYKYGISSQGLGFGVQEAVRFALELALPDQNLRETIKPGS